VSEQHLLNHAEPIYNIYLSVSLSDWRRMVRPLYIYVDLTTQYRTMKVLNQKTFITFLSWYFDIRLIKSPFVRISVCRVFIGSKILYGLVPFLYVNTQDFGEATSSHNRLNCREVGQQIVGGRQAGADSSVWARQLSATLVACRCGTMFMRYLCAGLAAQK